MSAIIFMVYQFWFICYCFICTINVQCHLFIHLEITLQMKEKNIKGRSKVEEQLFLGEMWVVHGVCDLCSLDLGKTSALAHWLTLVQFWWKSREGWYLPFSSYKIQYSMIKFGNICFIVISYARYFLTHFQIWKNHHLLR